MANGQQIADQNVQRFAAWVASKSDEEFLALVSRGVLSRKVIAEECSFAKSALDQNPRIKSALRKLEDSLRARGVLPPLEERKDSEGTSTLVREPSRTRTASSEERLARLEQENAGLKAELEEVKRILGRYAVLSEALATSGRLPR